MTAHAPTHGVISQRRHALRSPHAFGSNTALIGVSLLLTGFALCTADAKHAGAGGASSSHSFIARFKSACGAFWVGLCHPHASRKECIYADKELREHLSERQIDKMVEDSFPASDSPSTY